MKRNIKNTIKTVPYTQVSELDELRLYDVSSKSWADIRLGGLASYVESGIDLEAVGAQYRGVLNAAASGSVPTDDYTNGDWFFVSVAGTIEGENVDVNDIIKLSDGAWQRVPRGVATAANSRQTLLSSQTAIAGGAGEPSKNPDGKPGWFYENDAGGKINWYFYGDTNYTNNTMESFEGMYAVVDIESGYMYFNIYTMPTGSGDASWYKSRINWDDDTGQLVQSLAPGRYVIHTEGMDVSAVDSTLPRVSIPKSVAFSAGAGADSEEVWLMALSSSSNFPAGYNKFTVEQFAYRFDAQTHIMDLVAMPELPAVGEPITAADPGTKFWMSPVGNGGALLASGGGYTMYAANTAASPSDVELTMAEAADAASSRVFMDYTGKTLAERADLTEPIVRQDEKVLAEVTRLVKGYFHSQELTLNEIINKMNIYAGPLQAAQAGSVELTLAQLESIYYYAEETDVVDAASALLTLHLAKFPR